MPHAEERLPSTPNEAETKLYRSIQREFYSVEHYGVFAKADDSADIALNRTNDLLRDLSASCGVNWHCRNDILNVTATAVHPHHTVIGPPPHKSSGDGARIELSAQTWPASWQASFDVVWALDAFPRSTDVSTSLRESARALRPGGFLAFSAVHALPPDDRASCDMLHGHVLPLDKYEKVLAECGVDILRTRDLTPQLLANIRLIYSEMKASATGRRLPCTINVFKHLEADINAQADFRGHGWGLAVCRKRPITPAPLQRPVGPLRRYVAAKLHNIAVTDKSLKYNGSIGICRKLLAASGMQEFECVDVINLRNGNRWTTYAIPNDQEGGCALNGGGARLGEVGDECIIVAYGLSAEFHDAVVVFCDGSLSNKVLRTFTYQHGDDAGANSLTMDTNGHSSSLN